MSKTPFTKIEDPRVEAAKRVFDRRGPRPIESCSCAEVAKLVADMLAAADAVDPLRARGKRDPFEEVVCPRCETRPPSLGGCAAEGCPHREILDMRVRAARAALGKPAA